MTDTTHEPDFWPVFPQGSPDAGERMPGFDARRPGGLPEHQVAQVLPAVISCWPTRRTHRDPRDAFDTLRDVLGANLIHAAARDDARFEIVIVADRPAMRSTVERRFDDLLRAAFHDRPDLRVALQAPDEAGSQVEDSTLAVDWRHVSDGWGELCGATELVARTAQARIAHAPHQCLDRCFCGQIGIVGTTTGKAPILLGYRTWALPPAVAAANPTIATLKQLSSQLLGGLRR